VTPGLQFTRGGAAAGVTGNQAVDLSEIRRSEDVINVLAARGAAGPELKADPVLALLGALAADVDTPSTLGGPGQARPGWPRRAARGHAEARQALASPPSRGVAAWLRAAVAGAVVAGLASVTSLLATSMLARLARARGPARDGRWAQQAGRPRRRR
jgi:hypothetical protein